MVAPISGQHATCTFTDVAPGIYAVAFFHAEKGETKMRTGFFGQPEEGYGFSRDARGSMGPRPSMPPPIVTQAAPRAGR